MKIDFDYSSIYTNEDNQIVVNEVGCGCCGDTYGLSKKDVLDLIKELKEKVIELEKFVENL